MVMLSPAKQREAVKFLADRLFSPDPLEMSPGFAERLEPSRWLHWGMPFMPAGREDFPYHSRILAMQRPIVQRLTHPVTLSRLVDAELYGPGAFGIMELFDTMGNAVWTEVVSPAPGSTGSIGTVRRGAQRLWLDRLIEVAFTPDPGTPDDARAAARMHLMDLEKKIDARLAGGVADGITRAHLTDSQARIQTALRAGYELEVMKPKG
jgi:hypothetical protein